MPKHNGIKPPAQPRSLRTIAETNTDEFDNSNSNTVQEQGTYADVAEGARPTQDIGRTAADPNPFNLSSKR